jgi:adenylate cyclase
LDTLVSAEILQFENFRLDPRGGGLFRRDEQGSFVPVAIGSRALELLRILVARAGDVVARQEIMEAVWPGIAVEDSNLTVQLSALRRILDADRVVGSCIQTVPGRGYRFVVPAHHQADALRPFRPEAIDKVARDQRLPAAAGGDREALPSGLADAASVSAAPPRLPCHGHGFRIAAVLAALCLATVTLLAFGAGHWGWLAGSADRPRLSLVVLPFDNLSGDPRDDYLAEGITDDLTSDLSYISGAFVIARETAYSYQGKPQDVRKIGAELGVRYVLEGSVRRIGSSLRVNVQLISGATGAHLWSDRFDEQISELAAGQEQIVARMRDELGISMVEIESARSLRERPSNPDAFDLILRARALQNQPQSLQRDRETLALYERVLLLDPSSVPALAWVAYYLIDGTGGWGTFATLRRAEQLLARARAIAPNSELVLNSTVYWLRSVGRCQEVIEAAGQAIQADPNRIRLMLGVYNELGVCETRAGHPEEDIALQETANRLNPRSPWKFSRYRHIGLASLLLGRNQDAITFLQRSIAANPDVQSGTPWIYRDLAAAYARTGQMDEARHWLSEADRLWPFDTVRSHMPEASSSPVYAEQIKAYQAALRLAGERDHADEDADFGMPVDDILHGETAGPTPTDAPGAKTIRTADLVRLLAQARPVVIDTVANSWGRSIPGAVQLQFAGLGGSLDDEAQDQLRSKLHELTAGDRNRPVVAVGWNSERFGGRNLALRLVALGYTQVYWYRGGREAWEVANLPETELISQQW